VLGLPQSFWAKIIDSGWMLGGKGREGQNSPSFERLRFAGPLQKKGDFWGFMAYKLLKDRRTIK
jgi:hypothetical protein